MGDFQPGKPITITVDVDGVRSTGATDLELYLPELTAYQESPATYRGLRRQSRMTPAQTDRLQLGRGTKTIRTFSVVFPESGFYTVQVVAKQTTPEPIRDWVPESATANAWILVLDTGGRFSAVYDSTMILKDAVSTGPFRHVDPTKNAPPQAGVQAVGGEPQRFCEVDCPPRNCCFGGTLTYSNPLTGQIEPMNDVKVVLNITGPAGGVWETQPSLPI